MNNGPTTVEEIADVIFNLADPELNDMLQNAQKNNYEIDYLLWKMSADINGHFGDRLTDASTSAPSRKSFLFEKIKSELVYYAKWY